MFSADELALSRPLDAKPGAQLGSVVTGHGEFQVAGQGQQRQETTQTTAAVRTFAQLGQQGPITAGGGARWVRRRSRLKHRQQAATSMARAAEQCAKGCCTSHEHTESTKPFTSTSFA
jgi:hypothetical protein